MTRRRGCATDAMRLDAWRNPTHDIEFDPHTGTATVITRPAPRPDTSVPIGFAVFEKPLFRQPIAFALFKSGDALYFAAGDRRWRLGHPGLRFVHDHPFPFFSRFRVFESDRVVFSIVYSHLRRLLVALADPTYDTIDQDADFFLEFVAKHAESPEWRASIERRWASATGP